MIGYLCASVAWSFGYLILGVVLTLAAQDIVDLWRHQ